MFASGAQVTFFLGGTSTPITTYSDPALTSPQASPVIADANGVFPGIYLPYGTYRRRIVDQNGVLISDLDLIDNLAPPTGGGGLAVTIDQVLQTGDPLWRLRTGIMTGFVRMNFRTIGSAASAATEYANTLAAPLFTFIWQTFIDGIAPVSGGRGASPAADFAANKTISIPSMQGLIPVGLDDMGGTAQGIIQAITTCSTNNTTTVTVVSASRLTVGMSAIVNGISVGPILSVLGTAIGLTSVAAGTAAGVSFRASGYPDATGFGNVGGVITIKPTFDQMTLHTHVLTDPGHVHSYNQPAGGNASAGGANFVLNTAPAGNTVSAVTGVAITGSGGGNPILTMPPSRLGTWYMKL